MLVLLVVFLFPANAAAQVVADEAKIVFSKEDKRKRDQADQLYQQAGLLLGEGKALEAEPLYAEALLLNREVLGKEHPYAMTSLHSYAVVLDTVGRTAEAEVLYAEVLQLRREVLGAEHPDTLNSLNNYTLVLMSLGRYDKAASLAAEALRLRRKVLGAKHPDTLTSLHRYAFALDGLGRTKQAEQLFSEVLRLRREVLGEKHPDTLNSLNSYANVLNDLGRSIEAEPLSAEVLRLRRDVLGEKNRSTVISLNNYAVVLDTLGRTKEAEPLFSEALRLQREMLGAKHPYTLASMDNYAIILISLGRYDEAESPAIEALLSRRELLGEKHPDTLASLSTVANGLNLSGRPRESQPFFAEILRLNREVLGARHPDTLASLNNYAHLLVTLDRSSVAEPLLAEALPLHIDVFGEKHPNTISLMGNLALSLINQPSRSHLALGPARSLTKGIRDAREMVNFTAREEAIFGRTEKSNTAYFRFFADAAWARGPGLVDEARAAEAISLNANEHAQLREETFAALQDALAGVAGKAISASVARKAAGPLEPLVLERETLSQEWVDTDKVFIKSLSESVDAVDGRRQSLRAQLSELEEQIRNIDLRLSKEAPDYFSLIRPETLSLAGAQEVLASDEVALMIVPTNYGTHIMLVSEEGLRWVRSDWNNDKIDAAVKRLLWDVGANVDGSAAETAEWSEEGSGAYPYAFDRAYALYSELIAPIADGLKGKRHVFISASGPLSSLPFGMLVSEIPVGETGDPKVLRSAKWFADDHALVQIPTLQSLEFLRKYRTSDGASAKSPFLGIGDPVLAGKSQTRGSRRSLKPNEKTNGAFQRLFRKTQTRGEVAIADISELRKMARLPGTANELTAMWEEFGKPANALYLADQATEDFVRTQSLDANVIAFATHGLLAGEINGAAEPGLVLTPPSKASESNDGYLSASEIAALKINADWVILSACNTAAGDGGEGAPGLSGLARSFFYAGARNLLASHWPVRDDVAAKLTVRTISIAKNNPQLSRAQAFQQAMREIRNDESADSDNDTWAHPSAWAPFSLIGDGAR